MTRHIHRIDLNSKQMLEFAPHSAHSADELLAVFESALWKRALHPEQSSMIARQTYGSTRPNREAFLPPPDLLRLRDEFGTLEAPGMPDDETLELDEYVDSLWRRLSDLVIAARHSQR